MDQRAKDMMKMAKAIADLADAEAETFENVPGDVALRMFADSIRRTNNAMSDKPLPIN